MSVRPRALITLWLPLVCASVNSPAASAQQPRPADLAAADSLYFAFQPAAALAFCEHFLETGESAEMRWRAARAAIALGMLDTDLHNRLAFYDTALSHARIATKQAPADNETRYWVAAAAGRRTHRSDPVNSAHLAREAYAQVMAILATDSTHAGAHHVLGRMHTEVSRVPRLLRLIASRVLRIDVARAANRKDAEIHLRRAVELDSTMILYAVDLADLYALTGRAAEARRLALRIAAMPSRHPMDDKLRATALERWGR